MLKKKMPLVLVLLLFLIPIVGEYIPLAYQQTLYGVSLSIKSLIIFLLPTIIFGLLFKATANMTRGATRTFGIILLGVCVSNLLVTLLVQSVGNWIHTFNLSSAPPDLAQKLQAKGVLSLPQWLNTKYSLFAGAFLGIFSGRFTPELAKKWAENLDRLISYLFDLIIYLTAAPHFRFCFETPS